MPLFATHWAIYPLAAAGVLGMVAGFVLMARPSVRTAMFFIGAMLATSFVVALCGSVVMFQIGSPFLAIGLLYIAWSLFPNTKHFAQAAYRGSFAEPPPPTPPQEPSLHDLRFNEIYTILRQHYCRCLERAHNRHIYLDADVLRAEESMRIVERHAGVEQTSAVQIRRKLYDQIQYLLITQTSNTDEIVDEAVSKGLRTVACWQHARNHWKIDPEWRTEAVVGLCRGQYEEAKSHLLPVIADALEDAGCAHPDILAHCRSDIGDHQCGLSMMVLGRDAEVSLFQE